MILWPPLAHWGGLAGPAGRAAPSPKEPAPETLLALPAWSGANVRPVIGAESPLGPGEPDQALVGVPIPLTGLIALPWGRIMPGGFAARWLLAPLVTNIVSS